MVRKEAESREKTGTAMGGCPRKMGAWVWIGPKAAWLLFGGASFGGGFGVLLGEALDAAGGVNQFLLAGEVRVAARADFDAQHIALDGRARLKRVAAGAVHGHGMIIRVDTGFH